MGLRLLVSLLLLFRLVISVDFEPIYLDVEVDFQIDEEPQEPPSASPLPKCETCPTIEQLQAPDVGFALEPGHG